MAKTKTVLPTAELVAEEVQPGQGIKAEQINKLVTDVKAINIEVETLKTTNISELTSKLTELTATVTDLNERLTALETPTK